MRSTAKRAAPAMLVGLVLGLGASALPPVAGQLVVAGTPVRITKAYAYSQPGFFDPKKKDVVVVLCDGDVPPNAVRDSMERSALASQGRIHCIEQTIDADRRVINYRVQHERFHTPEGGGSSAHVFEPAIFDAVMISGRSRTTVLQKSFDEVPYTYDVTFSATISRR
jgi:hypothetical protein